MTTTAGIQYLDLADTYLHPLNPRQQVPEGDAELMAASIGATGLLQNLIGYRDPDRDGVGIVGGGRRWRGLMLLAEAGDWTAKIPVAIQKTAQDAISAAATENEAHLPLSPAQEIRLYAHLTNREGATPRDIARAHGVTERHVSQRLRLACLPEPVIAALEAQLITIDIARAFTLSDDETKILYLLDQVAGTNVNAWSIRNAFAKNTVKSDDNCARYIGEDAYIAAGGTITRDLFSDEDIWHDPKLLNTLAQIELTTDAIQIKAEEGWMEVRTALESRGPDYREAEKLRAIFPTPVDLPEADAAELEELCENNNRSPEEHARMVELEARARGDYSDSDRAIGIIFIWPGRDGKLKRSYAYTAKAQKAPATTSGSATASEPDTASISQALRDDLHRIQTGAFQAAMMDPANRDLAMALLAYEARFYSFNRISSVQFGEPPNTPTIIMGLDLPDTVTETRIDTSDKPNGDELTALLAGDSRIDFLRVLQHSIARSITARPDAYGRAVMAKAGIDVRKHWTPTAENFFARCKPAYLNAVFAELLPDNSDAGRTAFAILKKAEKAAVLDRLFKLDASVIEKDLTDADQARIKAWLPEDIRPEAGA
jgi:ParB family chromosome partitioning protein